MFEKLSITRMAQSLAAQSAARLGVIARNVAQADTPGYKAQDLPSFADSYQAAKPDGMRATRPGHLHASSQMLKPVEQASSGEMSPNGNTVSLEQQLVKSVDARQQHDMALAVYRSTSEIIKTSLGRN
ncbi:MAG: FlgB family protein [Alphaproteobacteria bacterium]